MTNATCESIVAFFYLNVIESNPEAEYMKNHVWKVNEEMIEHRIYVRNMMEIIEERRTLGNVLCSVNKVKWVIIQIMWIISPQSSFIKGATLNSNSLFSVIYFQAVPNFMKLIFSEMRMLLDGLTEIKSNK